MTTFVLVHGAGGGAWEWKKVAAYLHAAGSAVHAVTLTGCGERRHLVTAATGLDTHVADVVHAMAYEDLTGVILVGHSYGGNVITGVADAAPERLAHLVYLDANVPRDGQSLTDLAYGPTPEGRARFLARTRRSSAPFRPRTGGPWHSLSSSSAGSAPSSTPSSYWPPWPPSSSCSTGPPGGCSLPASRSPPGRWASAGW
jgi:pimeloyl-ACP methyl ester carboxylesterase